MMSHSVQIGDIEHIKKIVRMFQKSQEHFGEYIPQVDLDDLIGKCIDRWGSSEHKYDSDIALRKTFINAVIKREIQDFLRKWGRPKRKNFRNSFLDLDAPISENRNLSDVIPDFRYAADRQLLEAELKEKLSDVVKKFTPALKAIYDLIEEIEGLDPEGFSKDLKISTSSVYERIARLRKFIIKEGLMGYSKKYKAFLRFCQRSQISSKNSDIF